MAKDKILVAGATGYLGKYITRQLLSEGFKTKIIVRNPDKVEIDNDNLIIEKAEVTRPDTLKGVCKDVRVVISTVGITRQKDGLTYMDVDYKANANLIDEAKKSGVERFIYVSVLNGEKLKHLKICEAKEKLGDYLKSSGLDYCIVRPSGFFSDMGDFLKMAKSGRVYLFGDGKFKINPIHGEDLAKAIVETIHNGKKEIDIGGCRVFSHNEIAELALKACSKPVKIVHLPDWIRRFTLRFLRTFTNSKSYGPLEFFMTAMAMDMQAAPYGTHKLEDYFENRTKPQTQHPKPNTQNLKRQMKIRKIYACWVYVSDMEQSVRFYQDIGFTVKFVEDDGVWVEFDLGETSFALLQRPAEKGKVQPRKTRIMFEVAHIEKMQEHLISLGVRLIGGIREEPYGKLLTFEDPDGHWLEFFENNPKPNT